MNNVVNNDPRDVIQQLNLTAKTFSDMECLQTLFDNQAQHTPNKIALLIDNKQITYAELLSKSNQLAHYLKKKKIPENSYIAVHLERSFDLVISIIAILKVRCAYIPLDINHPLKRLDYILKDSQACALITRSEYSDKFNTNTVNIIELDKKHNEINKQLNTVLNVKAELKDTAYIIYTSGSTGQPKGVVANQESIINRLNWMWSEFPFESDEICCQKTSISFIDSVCEIFGPLLTGIKLVLIKDEDSKDVSILLEKLIYYSVTRLVVVPSLLNALLEQPPEKLKDLGTSLKICTCSGEALMGDLVDRFYRNFSTTKLLNLYGSTEVAADATYKCLSKLDAAQKYTSIGKPISNMFAYILDESCKLVSIGDVGELYIGGVGLAQRYLNQPELTQQKFVKNPYVNDKYSIMYKTGDLARYLHDGDIQYVGRIDNQVKINGYRIEIGEIESLIKQHKAVNQAVIIIKAISLNLNKIVAFVTLKSKKTQLTMQMLNVHLREYLPSYMLINQLITLEEIPLTISGKIDRQYLMTHDLQQDQINEQYVPPKTPDENVLANFLKELLVLENVSVNDDFFILGGNSLLAAQLIARIQSYFCVELTLKKLYQYPTISLLAQFIRSNDTRKTLSSLQKKISQVNNDVPSFAQQRIWFVEKLFPGYPIYNLSSVYQLKGPLDVNKLQKALNIIMARHAVLRTRFYEEEGLIKQSDNLDFNFLLEIESFMHFGDEEVHDKSQSYLLGKSQEIFDLTKAPFVRGTLLQIKEQFSMLLITMHHIISDGWSLEVFFNELSFHYNNIVTKSNDELPKLNIQYSNYSLWQTEQLKGALLSKQSQYWQTQLSNLAPKLELMPYNKRPNTINYRGCRINRTISHDVFKNIEQFAQLHHVTLFNLLHACFSLLLMRYSGQYDVVVGVPISNRRLREFEPLIGFFVNMLPLRTKVEPHISFLQFLAHCKNLFIDAHEHQDLPFEKMVDVLKIHRNVNANPIFQHLLNYEEYNNSSLNLVNIKTQSIKLPTEYSKFDMTFNVSTHDNYIDFEIEYSTELFDKVFIEQFLTHLIQLMENAVQNSESRIDQINYMNQIEIDKYIRQLNIVQHFNTSDTLINIFEHTVRLHGNRIALTDGQMNWTYEEINGEANQLARYLQNFVETQNQFIGICLDKEKDFIISILAILKLGCAYVPLDPHSPAERLNYIQNDSGLKLVISKSQFSVDKESSYIFIDSIQHQLSHYSNDNLNITINNNNIAYIIYTSGSTGKPKGVKINHYSVVRLFCSTKHLFTFNENDIWTLFSSMAFDVSVWEMWGAFKYGAKLVIVPRMIAKVPDEFYNLIRTMKVTVLNQTPSAFYQLSQYAQNQKNPATDLRYVIFAGEALNIGMLKPWISLHGYQMPKLINMYGITEGTVHVTFAEIDLNHLEKEHISNIGNRLSDLTTYVFDELMQPVPMGIIGELYVGGPGIACGYHNRPELTELRFIQNPFNKKEIIYKTGDRVCYLEDNTLAYFGRKDDQIKLRGFRIELGEIESVVRLNEHVKQVAVIVRELADQHKQLLAFVILKKSKQANNSHLIINQIKSELKKQLPDYMVPADIFVLKEIPLNLNGKIDKDQLLKFAQEASLNENVEFNQVNSEIQHKLISIWQTILQKKNIRLTDNFFEIGGHSLLALQLISKINRLFNMSCPVKSIFENPTILMFSEYLQQQEVVFQKTSLEDIGLSKIENVYRANEKFPLTAIQQAYFIGRSDAVAFGGTSVYSYTEYDYDHLDFNKLEQSWNLLIKRHPALRLIFLSDVTQKVLEDVSYYYFKINDYRNVKKKTCDKKLIAIREKLSHAILPHDQWPLFNIQITLYENKVRLHVGIDALILDAWSENLIFNEWVQLYQNPQSHLEVLNYSYKEYIYAEIQQKQSIQYQGHREYWLNRLAQFPLAPQLPTLVQDKNKPVHFSRLTRKLDKNKWHLLKLKMKEHKLTPTAFLAAIYAKVLAGWSKTSHFAINLTTFNRLPLHDQINKIAGDFTSLILLEIDLRESQKSFIDEVVTIQNRLWQDLDHGLYNALDVLRELSKRKEIHQDQLMMPVVFTCILGLDHETESSPLCFNGNSYKEIYGITQTPQVWLDYKVYEREGGLIIEWDYLDNIFPENMLQDMFDIHYEMIDRFGNSNVWQQPRFDLMPTYQKTLRGNINNTVWPVSHQLIHQLFNQQAQRLSDHLAIITSQKCFTYQELLNLSLNLAKLLKDLAVRSDQLIAVIMQKGWEQIVGSLGILQSGAAYLPIDPEMPIERINKLLQTTHCKIIISQTCMTQKLTALNFSGHTIVVDEKETLNYLSSQKNKISKSDQDINTLAYVIFTSGSTGEPKGVMLTHKSVANTLQDINDRYQIDKNSRVLALSNLNFDLSVYDIFGILAAGGTIVIPDLDKIMDPKHWLEMMTRYQVNVWNTVPTFMQMLIEYLDNDFAEEQHVPLKLVMLSGDWIPLHLYSCIKKYFYDHNTHTNIVSLGGATEAAIWSIYFNINYVDAKWKSIPYGKPLRNQQFYVLHDDFTDCPTWVTGHLYISGEGLAKGYWNDPIRTKQSFIQHPLNHQMLYKTGDLGRYLPDGNIEFLGREDFQVKINGHRIELGEIKYAIEQYPGISQAEIDIVTLNNKNQLHAYVVTQNKENAENLDKTISFKLAQHGLREFPSGHPTITLENALTNVQRVTYFSRKSYRAYYGNNLNADQIQQWLHESCLSYIENLQMDVPSKYQDVSHEMWLNKKILSYLLLPFKNIKSENQLLPKYRYPSAGSLYPVQLYIAVNSKDTDGINPGYYYYNPTTDQLNIIDNQNLDRSDVSQLTFYFVAKLSAIEPLYGDISEKFCWLEAGYMLGLLKEVIKEQKLSLTTTTQNIDHACHKLLNLTQQDKIICEITLKKVEHKDEVLIENMPFEIYLYLLNGIEQYQKGWYCFNAVTRKLEFINESCSLTQQNELHIFKDAHFIVFLSQKRKQHNLAVNLDVGTFSQYLMEKGIEQKIGLCPIGGLSNTQVNSLPKFVSYDKIIHILAGGSITNDQIISDLPSEKISDDNFNTKNLIEYIKNKLPSYMVPKQITLIESIPLTVNGKIDRKKLSNTTAAKHSLDNEIISPRSITEEQLLSIWNELLEITVENVFDNFFEMGGNSILAIRLMTKLNGIFNKSLSVLDIYKHPTIAQLASLLNQSVIDIPPDTLLIFKNEEELKNVFLVHPISGLSFCYLPLMMESKQINIIGINNPLFAKQKQHFNSVQEMAASYIKALRSIQPTGPYILGGWSFGGVVAYEMAQQLHKAEQTVEVVILFDSYNKTMFSSTTMTPEIIKNDLIEEGILPDSKEGKYFQFEVEHNWHLLMKYEPQQYHGRLAIIKAQEGVVVDFIEELFNGWLRFSELPIELYSIHGTHGKMFFKEKVDFIIQKLHYILGDNNSLSRNSNPLSGINQVIKYAESCHDDFIVKLLIKFKNEYALQFECIN